MSLDPSLSYFLVGKTTAQSVPYAQADAMVGMELIFSCVDFSGYSGPPGWGQPTHWQSSDATFTAWEQNFNPGSIYGVSGAEEDSLAGIELTFKYTSPEGDWIDSSEFFPPREAATCTGLFLVGIKGVGTSSMAVETWGDFSGWTGEDPGPRIAYAYSTTDGGQRVYVQAYAAPGFQALIEQVLVYAAYDVPPPPPAFWTNILGSREIL